MNKLDTLYVFTFFIHHYIKELNASAFDSKKGSPVVHLTLKREFY